METIRDIYIRTMNNCKFYKEKGDSASLLNEIGVLRGIAYCMEITGVPYPDFDEFKSMIETQNALKELFKEV